LQTENRELKVKLYDCWSKVTTHEKELVTAKNSLQEILEAYTELSAKYHEQKKELEITRDELERNLKENEIGIVKREFAEEQHQQQQTISVVHFNEQDIRERARKAIDQMEKTTRSMRLFEQQRVQAEAQLNRIKVVVPQQTQNLSNPNLNNVPKKQPSLPLNTSHQHLILPHQKVNDIIDCSIF
jgi:septation ring formation regulator EzrA